MGTVNPIHTPFLQEWRTRCHDNYILIAMRMDEESHSPLLRKIAALRSRAGAMPHTVQRIAYHTHKRLVDMHWRSRCARILKNNPQPHSCPIRRLDASIAESFEAFCQLVADARYIISDRMHVGILAYLLNKPATLIGNSYYKTQAVYEFSMNHEGSPVQFISGADA